MGISVSCRFVPTKNQRGLMSPIVGSYKVVEGIGVSSRFVATKQYKILVSHVGWCLKIDVLVGWCT